MNVILRLFSLSGVFVGFGEGVCDGGLATVDFEAWMGGEVKESRRLGPGGSSAMQEPGEARSAMTVASTEGPRGLTWAVGMVQKLIVVTTHATSDEACGEITVAGTRRTVGLEIFDGHKLGLFGVSLGNGFW